MNDVHRELIDVFKEARTLLARADNNFLWSTWQDSDDAIRTLDELTSQIERGLLPERSYLSSLFAPTGPIQEVSISSGWGEDFLAIAQRFDTAVSRVYG